MKYEFCTVCDNKTGKAVCGDGSLYTDDGSGPFCDACYHFQLQIEALSQRILDLEHNAKLDQAERIQNGNSARQAANAALYVANYGGSK